MAAVQTLLTPLAPLVNTLPAESPDSQSYSLRTLRHTQPKFTPTHTEQLLKHRDRKKWVMEKEIQRCVFMREQRNAFGFTFEGLIINRSLVYSVLRALLLLLFVAGATTKGPSATLPNTRGSPGHSWETSAEGLIKQQQETPNERDIKINRLKEAGKREGAA